MPISSDYFPAMAFAANARFIDFAHTVANRAIHGNSHADSRFVGRDNHGFFAVAFLASHNVSSLPFRSLIAKEGDCFTILILTK